MLTGKKHRQIKQKYEYRHLGCWYIKSTLYKKLLNWNKIFKKNKVVTGKTLLFVIGPFLHHSICLKILSDLPVLYGNGAFLILVLSTKKRYSNFLKRVCVFRKIYFTVKVLKMFEILTDCHIKTCRSRKRRAVVKIHSTIFEKNLCSFHWL